MPAPTSVADGSDGSRGRYQPAQPMPEFTHDSYVQRPKRVQTIMGHASIKMTSDVYGYLFTAEETNRAAMAQIVARCSAQRGCNTPILSR